MKLGATVEFMLPPLITSVSHCMGYTVVEFSSTMRLKAISFTNLLANSSTGKTPVYSYFDKALHNIERLNDIARNDSKISNCATCRRPSRVFEKQRINILII